MTERKRYDSEEEVPAYVQEINEKVREIEAIKQKAENCYTEYLYLMEKIREYDLEELNIKTKIFRSENGFVEDSKDLLREFVACTESGKPVHPALLNHISSMLSKIVDEDKPERLKKALNLKRALGPIGSAIRHTERYLKVRELKEEKEKNGRYSDVKAIADVAADPNKESNIKKSHNEIHPWGKTQCTETISILLRQLYARLTPETDRKADADKTPPA